MKENINGSSFIYKFILSMFVIAVVVGLVGLKANAADVYNYSINAWEEQYGAFMYDKEHIADFTLSYPIAGYVNGNRYDFHRLNDAGTDLDHYIITFTENVYNPDGTFNNSYTGSYYLMIPSEGELIVETTIPLFSTRAEVLNYLLTGDDTGQLNKPQIEVPEFDSLENDSDFCLKGFNADNSILATWDGTVTNEYENEVSFVVAYLGYAYKNQPSSIANVILYNAKVLITDNRFYIPWNEVQPSDEELFLRYVEFIPYGKINPDKVFYPYIKGYSAYIYFDDSGNIDSVKIPISVDRDSLTTNIVGGTFDSSIPALSDIERINNGFADPLSSYSQSVTFKWSTVFDDPNYYIQVRTTFRYKLNVDKVWEEITIDTSVPTGRFSCLVDNNSFTYTYGDYGPLFWRQDNSFWTEDSLDKHGNLQPVRDSIRVVHVEDGFVSYGPWTTFTLKNGIWETGHVTGSYESDILEEDNTGGSIVEDNEVNSNFLTDFDFTNVSGVWDAFVGMFKNLFSFLGQFPDLFSSIFAFLPYEIRHMMYVSLVAIFVIGLARAVIK